MTTLSPSLSPTLSPTLSKGEVNPAGTVEWVLGSRQLAAIAFVLIALMASIASVSYLAGRVLLPSGQDSAASPQGKRPPEQIIVVDPATASGAPAAASTPVAAAAAPVRQASPAASPSPGRPAAPAAISQPAPGTVFLQVGVVERGMAEICVEYLTRKGYTARVAPGPEDSFYRILVGPVVEGAQVEPLRSGLQQLGFRSFLKRY